MILDNLLSLLATGRDSALLRYGLGGEYLKADNPTEALPHLAQAVTLDPDYSAAWKLYGKALAATDQPEAACRAFTQGIAVAEAKGDVQAVREMRVFLKRAQRATGADP